MMEHFRPILMLALTWLPGCVLVARLVPKDSPARLLLVSGYGLLLGLITVPLIMRALSAAGVSFSLISIGLPLVLLFVLGLLIPEQWRSDAPCSNKQLARHAHFKRWEIAITCLCAALIFSRLVTLGMEVWWRPIYGWDGKQHWAKQAKIIFELGFVPHYVPYAEWLELGGKNVYTTAHSNYPITVPLLQVWDAIALGQWHESLINIPWFLCFMALGLIFFGQARAAGASTAVAAAATYMLLSLPLLNIHVALAGYADLFLATVYLASVSAFFNWSQSGARGQAILWIGFALSCPLIKNEGLFWTLTFIPGLILVLLGLKRGFALIMGLFLLMLPILWLLPGDLVVAGVSLDQLNLRYRPESWEPIYRSFLVQDNWHLLIYLLIIMIAFALARSGTTPPHISPVAVVVGGAFCLFFALYLLTNNSFGAVRYTSVNRVALQLIPAMAFLLTLIYLKLTFKSAG